MCRAQLKEGNCIPLPLPGTFLKKWKDSSKRRITRHVVMGTTTKNLAG